MTIVSNAHIAHSSWPAGGLEAVSSCPVCRSIYRRTLYEGLSDRLLFGAPGEWTLYKCLDCGCGYLDPRPTMQTIILAYQQYNTHVSPGKVTTDALNVLRRLRRMLANGFLNWRFGTDFRPSSRVFTGLTRHSTGVTVWPCQLADPTDESRKKWPWSLLVQIIRSSKRRLWPKT